MVRTLGLLAVGFILQSATAVNAVTQDDCLKVEIKSAQELLHQYKNYEAELAFQKALKQAVQIPNNKLQVVECFNFIGASQHAQGKSEEAIKSFRKAFENLPNEKHWRLRMKILSNISLAYSATGEKTKALDSIKESILISSKHKIGSLEESVLLNNFGQLLMANDDLAQAELALTKSIKLRENVLGKASPQLISPLVNLSLVYMNCGNLIASEQCCKRAISISNMNKSSEDVVFSAWNNLADIYVRKHNLQEAENCLEKAYEIAERRFGSTSPQTLKIASNLAYVYEANGKIWSANQIFERIRTSTFNQ